MKVRIYPIAGDGIDNIPTWPEPIALADVGRHLEGWLRPYQEQGYYSDVRQRRIPLNELTFRIEFAEPEPEPPNANDKAERPLTHGAPWPRTEAQEKRRWYDQRDQR